MGTRNNPGKFDCYDKAEPDEPIFVLLGRDPQAAHLVSIWSKLRAGDVKAADHVYHHLRQMIIFDAEYPRPGTTDMEKSMEAMDCSLAMFFFREARVANQSVKAQGDTPQGNANSPGERG